MSVLTDRTGMARGRVSPIIYFQNASGYVILPPMEIGKGPALAKQIYEQKYKHQGWQWCETDGSFHDAERLQRRLQDQAYDEAKRMQAGQMEAYDAAKRRTASDLRAQMTSAACDPWEREFIRLWLDMSPEKRAKHEQRFAERSSYLWAVEMDASRKIEERMPMQEGEFFRNEAQQKA